MSEMISIDREELTQLETRLKKLAKEKAYLQLYVRLMNRMSASPGLDNAIENMLKHIHDIMGGNNLILYYFIDQEIFYADVFGKRAKLERIEDDDVRKSVETGKPIEYEHDFSDTKMMTPEFYKACTFVFPLFAGEDMIGVFKMESITSLLLQMKDELPSFFNFAALILKNEILGHTKLKKAYDQLNQANAELTREISERKRIEEALRNAKEKLEERVLERTEDLRNANEQLQAELIERRRAEDALHRSEERYRSLVENQTDIISRFTPDGTSSFVNNAYIRFFNKTKDELIGHKWQPVAVPEDLPFIIEKLQTLSPSNPAVIIENRIYSGTGNIHWFQFVNWGFFDPAGNLLEIQSVGRDITDQKRAEAEIRRLNAELERRVIKRTAQLEAANKEMEAFCYSVSHDLRSPLRSIDGWSLAIVEDYADKLDETGKKYLNRIRTDTQRMAQLIDDLLKLSRLNRSEIQLQPINLSELAQRIADTFKETYTHRQAAVFIQPNLTAQADQGMITIVLTNLFENAWKFTANIPVARIEFGKLESEDANKQIFFIKDNGIGFDMRYASKMFGAFQRLHKEKDFPGTGIGLAIVQRIINRHGGKVWAEAAVNQGATFYFEL